METIVGEYVEEIFLPDNKSEVVQTFTSLTDQITYTGYKVHFVLYLMTSTNYKSQ